MSERTKRNLAQFGQYTPEELQRALEDMRLASSAFYSLAIRSNVHALIEFTGLINEFIKICEQTYAGGTNFVHANKHSGELMVAHSYNIDYIADKFECIFGPILADEKAWQQFCEKMGHGRVKA